MIREIHLRIRISEVTANSRQVLVTRDTSLHCILPVDTSKINFKSQIFRPLENCHPWIYFVTIGGNLPEKHLCLHIQIQECDCPFGKLFWLSTFGNVMLWVSPRCGLGSCAPIANRDWKRVVSVSLSLSPCQVQELFSLLIRYSF